MKQARSLILVVEDNVDNRILLRDILSMLGYEVIEAVDGVDGVQMAAEHVPLLILMDLSLPRKDGWTATQEIKANAKLSHIPVIALTAHAMLGDRERALASGCDDYIAKPIRLAELTQKLKTYLPD